MWSLSNEQQQKQQHGNVVTAEVNASKKKKKALECNCTSVKVEAAKSGFICDKCEKEQKFGSNSKEHELKFGIGKEVEEEATDSGFISGPNISCSLAFEENSDKFVNTQKPNVSEPVPKQQQQKQQGNIRKEESKTFLDSGCIEPEEDEEFEIEDDVNITNSKKNVDVSATNDAAKTDVGVMKRQSEAQVQNELHNIKVGAAVRQRTSSENIKIADEMRFKNNVDSGISERFCSLSLQSGGVGINNLNSAPRRSSTTSVIFDGAQPQQTVRQQSLPAMQQQPPLQKIHQKPRTAVWEEFYQQNSEGDT